MKGVKKKGSLILRYELIDEFHRLHMTAVITLSSVPTQHDTCHDTGAAGARSVDNQAAGEDLIKAVAKSLMCAVQGIMAVLMAQGNC